LPLIGQSASVQQPASGMQPAPQAFVLVEQA